MPLNSLPFGPTHQSRELGNKMFSSSFRPTFLLIFWKKSSNCYSISLTSRLSHADTHFMMPNDFLIPLKSQMKQITIFPQLLIFGSSQNHVMSSPSRAKHERDTRAAEKKRNYSSLLVSPHPDCSLSSTCIINSFKNILSSDSMRMLDHLGRVERLL